MKERVHLASSHLDVTNNNIYLRTWYNGTCAAVVLFIVLFNSKFNSQLIRRNKNKLNPSFDLFFFSSIIFIVIMLYAQHSLFGLESSFSLPWIYTIIQHCYTASYNTKYDGKLYEIKLEDLKRSFAFRFFFCFGFCFVLCLWQGNFCRFCHYDGRSAEFFFQARFQAYAGAYYQS